MRHPGWVRSRAIALLLAGTSAPAVQAIPGASEEWQRIITPRFTIISNASVKRARRVAVQLERFRSQLEGPDTAGAGSAFVPTTIVAFDDAESFSPYKLKADGTPESYVGVFLSTPDGIFIGMSLDPDDDPYGTVFHEWVHYINERRHLDIPLWLNEGMAEYYSTFRVDENTVEIGLPVEHHVLWLAQEPLLSFTELFEAGERAVGPRPIDSRSDEERRGLFYAESWALYHYLTRGHPELQPKLASFIDGWTGTTNANAAWKAAFGSDYEVTERALKEYVSTGRFRYLRIEVDRLPPVDVRTEPIPYAELLTTLGEYMAHVTPWQQAHAERHLQAALEQDRNNARAHVALACLLARTERGSEAAAHFDAAGKLAPADPEVAFRWGATLVAGHLESNSQIKLRPAPFPEHLATARELLDRSIRIEPRRAEAYIHYGYTYLFDPGDVRDGIAALEVGRNYFPARMDVAYHLMMLYLRHGDRSSAEGLANLVLSHARDPEWSAGAGRVLDMHATYTEERRQENLFNDAVDQYNAGNFAGAIALLDQLATEVKDAESGAAVRDLRHQAEEALAEQRRIDAHNRQVELYNEAIRKGRARDYAGAVAILEQLLPSVQDPALADDVRRALAEARKLLGR